MFEFRPTHYVYTRLHALSPLAICVHLLLSSYVLYTLIGVSIKLLYQEHPKGGEGASDCVHNVLVEVLSIALPYMDHVLREKRISVVCVVGIGVVW